MLSKKAFDETSLKDIKDYLQDQNLTSEEISRVKEATTKDAVKDIYMRSFVNVTTRSRQNDLETPQPSKRSRVSTRKKRQPARYRLDDQQPPKRPRPTRKRQQIRNERPISKRPRKPIEGNNGNDVGFEIYLKTQASVSEPNYFALPNAKSEQILKLQELAQEDQELEKLLEPLEMKTLELRNSIAAAKLDINTGILSTDEHTLTKQYFFHTSVLECIKTRRDEILEEIKRLNIIRTPEMTPKNILQYFGKNNKEEGLCKYVNLEQKETGPGVALAEAENFNLLGDELDSLLL